MSISARRLMRRAPATPLPPTTITAGSAPVGTTTYSVPTGAIFVATNGSDSNPGTLAQPVSTVKKARQLTPAGGTIVLRGGVYNEGFTGTASIDVWGGTTYAANVTIQSYPNEPVWFDGSIPLTNWTQNGVTWQVPFTAMFDRSPTFTFGADDIQAAYWSFVNPQYPTMPWPEMVFYDGVQLTQVDALNKVGPGTFFSQGSYPNTSGTQKYNFNITGIVIGDNPAGHEVRVTNQQGLFVLRDDGCSLKGVGIRRYAPTMAYQGALKLIGNNCTVENVHIEDIATVAAGGFTGDSQTWRSVTCTRAGTMGMTSSVSNNVLFDRCLITANNCHFSNYAPVAAGIKVSRLRKITIRNSIIRDNFASGVWFDECVTNATVDNCKVINNEQKGIISELSGDTLVHNTLVAGNGSYGIGSVDADGIHLYSTTIVNNGNGIDRFTGASFGAKRQIAVNADDRAPWRSGVPTDPRYPGPGQGHPDGITYCPQRTVVKNSLIDGPASGQALFAWEDFNRTDGSEWPWSAVGLNFAGNIWSRSGEEQLPWVLSKGANTFDIVSTIASFGSLTGTANTDIQTAITPMIDGSARPLASLPAVAFSPMPTDMRTRVATPATDVGARPTVV